MSLKLSHNELRFKFTKQELFTLLEGHKVFSSLNIEGAHVGYSVQAQDLKESCKLTYDEGMIHLDISYSVLKTLSDMGKDRKGLSFQINELTITLQLDMRSLSS
jgi:hypothetical protein